MKRDSVDLKRGSTRRRPIGAEPAATGTHFRVWAPKRTAVEAVLEGGGAHALNAEGDGYFSAWVPDTRAGARYRYRLDGGESFPDPASRYQPEGPHGPSEVIDPAAFSWTDASWRGLSPRGQVLYEMHIGTFTAAGTWRAAAEQLAELASLGVTVIEMMPVNEFAGTFGWGYDGVDLYAPYHHYGRPDDLRYFIDQAHAAGIGVILDVVYNHLGPDGNFLAHYADDYFTDRYCTDWGEAINFDGEIAGPVREFFVQNAGYWVDEFHFDGLRLDATQNIYDSGSGEHVLAAIGREVRRAAGGRGTLLVAENEPQETRLVRPVEAGGYGLDMLWNDDYHHTAMVALTKRHEAYYSDHRGRPQEFISAAKYGYLFQGQHYLWQAQRRGTPSLDLPPWAFVTFLQNHDQIANSFKGERCSNLTSPAVLRTLTALTLLGPGTPMLFQGQEFCASQPFLYFADHKPELAEMIRKGRAEFLAQFPSLSLDETQRLLSEPVERATYERCKLDFAEREKHAPRYQLHKDLLRLRREDPVFAAQRERGVDGAVLGEHAFVLRFFGGEHGDRLLIVNLDSELELRPVPEPLLAPPAGRRWAPVLSTEDPRYGGYGAPPPETEAGWHLTAECAVALAPVPARPPELAQPAEPGRAAPGSPPA